MTDLCRVFLFIYLIIVMIFFPSMIPRKTAIKPRILLASTLGMGIERITNLKYQVKDLRMFSENDVRFLRQFESAN